MLEAFQYAVPQDDVAAFAARFHPYSDNVLVEVEPDEFVTSGILVRRVAGEQSQIRSGRVLAVGPGRYGKRGGRIPVAYTPGDRVLFARGEARVKRVIDGRELRILAEDQLEGVVIDGEGRIEARFDD